jgi:hypothetical protein
MMIRDGMMMGHPGMPGRRDDVVTGTEVYRRTWQFLRKGADKVVPVPALAVTPSRVPGWQIIILFRLRIIAISNSRNFAC